MEIHDILFVTFNTNIIILLYVLVCVVFGNISYYTVVVMLDLAWIIFDTKQQNVGISSLVVALFGTLWMYYLCCFSCDINYYYYSDNIFVWISFRYQQKISPRISINSNNNTIKILYKHPLWSRVTSWQNSHTIWWVIWFFCNIDIQRTIYTIIPGCPCLCCLSCDIYYYYYSDNIFV